MRYYNIHGFWLAVAGDAERFFEREFRYFAAEAAPETVDCTVREVEPGRGLPIRQKGARIGLAISLVDGTAQIQYERGVNPEFVVQWAESFLWWEDKCLVHGAGVGRDGKAIVFCAGPNAGKTTTVFGLVGEGYSYFGGDWIVLGNGMAYPYPRTIRVHDYNVAHDWGGAGRALGFRTFGRWRMRMRLAFKNRALPLVPGRLSRYGLERLLSAPVGYLDVGASFRGTLPAEPSPLEKVFWLERCDGKAPLAQQIDVDSLCRRIVHMTLFERGYVLSWYHHEASRDLWHPYLEDVGRHQFGVLRKSLAQKVLIQLLIPWAYSPVDLIDVVRAHL